MRQIYKAPLSDSGTVLHLSLFPARRQISAWRSISFVDKLTLFDQPGKQFVRDATVYIGDDGVEMGLAGAEGWLLVFCTGVQHPLGYRPGGAAGLCAALSLPDGNLHLRLRDAGAYGASRFVIGLAADVTILESDSLRAYIRDYQTTYIQKL